jgi:hypothetical protein
MSAIVVYQRNMMVFGHDLDCRHMIHSRPTSRPAMLIDRTVVDIYDVMFFGKADLVIALTPLLISVADGTAGVNDTLTPLANNIPGFSILLRARDEIWQCTNRRWQPVPPSETLILGTPDIDPQVAAALRANTQVSPYLILQDLVDARKLGRAGFQVRAMS